MLKPGDCIGILGGGQLGRMQAIAAARLGLKTHIYCPEPDSPAFEVSAFHTVAPYEDEAALRAFASNVDVITLEFENVPVSSVRLLETLRPVRPGAKALEVAQDRLAEKTLANQLGAGTAPFAAINNRADLDAALATIGLPGVLKTNRFGYDGKGQAKIFTADDVAPAFAMLNGQQGILEGFIRFEREVSVIATRALDGGFTAFDVTENEHRNHILYRSVAPATLSAEASAEAIAIARKIGDALDYVGTFAVEFFVVQEGAHTRVIVNEIAPRVHNSGHWTIDGAVSCQFEQHIRAVAGWPLGSSERRCNVEMINLVGDEAADWLALVSDPMTKLHLYGKAEARRGRKMGHITRLLA